MGPSGGIIEGAPGTELDGVRLEIPAGALTGSVTIDAVFTDEEPELGPGARFVGPSFEFSPRGQSFAKPVKADVASGADTPRASRADDGRLPDVAARGRRDVGAGPAHLDDTELRDRRGEDARAGGGRREVAVHRCAATPAELPGLEPDERGRVYAPHVTLARSKHDMAFVAATTALATFASAPFRVGHVTLSESRSDRYQELHRAPLT